MQALTSRPVLFVLASIPFFSGCLLTDPLESPADALESGERREVGDRAVAEASGEGGVGGGAAGEASEEDSGAAKTSPTKMMAADVALPADAARPDASVPAATSPSDTDASGADVTVAAICGDGVKGPDEECDDGDAQNTGAYGDDGRCTRECTPAPFCGDGIVNGDEACDFAVEGAVHCRGNCSVRRGAAQVAVGRNHTCALLLDGTVACWGDSRSGQLGRGALRNTASPSDVVGLSGVTALTSGEHHTCALRDTGKVNCWGSDRDGRLGDGASESSQKLPVNVLGLDRVIALGAGPAHSCAVRSDGRVFCWGANGAGQLGDGTRVDRDAPVEVVELPPSAVTKTVLGARHTCALLESGAVSCWGSNDRGQLGNGSVTDRTWPPVAVVGISDATALAADEHSTCALRKSGGVYCWGTRWVGESGQPVTEVSSGQPAVSGFSAEVRAFDVGSLCSCAVSTGGRVYCSGANYSGQLGNGTRTDSQAPVEALGLRGVTGVGVGRHHVCAIRADGGVSCWGQNDYGELGDNTIEPHNTPVRVIGLGPQ